MRSLFRLTVRAEWLLMSDGDILKEGVFKRTDPPPQEANVNHPRQKIRTLKNILLNTQKWKEFITEL